RRLLAEGVVDVVGGLRAAPVRQQPRGPPVVDGHGAALRVVGVAAKESAVPIDVVLPGVTAGPARCPVVPLNLEGALHLAIEVAQGPAIEAGRGADLVG